MKTISDDEFELSSGRKVYAHALIIGINPDLKLSYGYDGAIYVDGPVANDRDGRWSSDEKREFADYMIALWTKFRESA